LTACVDITTDLEFSLWKGNSKIYGEYVTTSKTVTYEYTPSITATYRINFRLRDYGYDGPDQTFYLDNVIIRDTALALIEENNYYPFGLKHQGYNSVVSSNANAVARKFKYNGKELNDELGLGLYDYGARFYDPALGRWHVIDPLAELYYSWSPYIYTLNNPVKYIDPDGKASGDPPLMYATEGAARNGEAIHKAYSNLPKDVKRIVSGASKIVFGLAQFIGGSAFATVTSPTVAGGIAGGATAMFGAYKVGEGIHQIANVISGTSDDSDPQYNTPVGAITESETVDNIVDLTLGAGATSSAGNTIISTINNVSTVNSGVDIVIESLSSKSQQNSNETETPKEVEDIEKRTNDDNRPNNK